MTTSYPSLASIGIDPIEERVYLALIEGGASSPGALASALDLPRQKVKRALDGLEAKGFAARTPDAGEYTPARPDLAIEALILRRQEELHDARRTADRLLERFRDSPAGSAELPAIELVRGRDAVAQWWVQLQRGARREVMIFDRPPYVMPFTGPNPVEMELLARGVTYRVLYDGSSFDRPEKHEAVRRCVEAGESARVRVGVPMKLLIADGELALTHHGADVAEHAVVVRHPAVLSGLVALYEALWRDSAPFSVSAHGTNDPLDDVDRSILAMLGGGAKDERIARQLRVSVRTVRRRITALTTSLGAETRFQAAVIAARKGLL